MLSAVDELKPSGRRSSLEKVVMGWREALAGPRGCSLREEYRRLQKVSDFSSAFSSTVPPRRPQVPLSPSLWVWESRVHTLSAFVGRFQAHEGLSAAHQITEAPGTKAPSIILGRCETFLARWAALG